MRGSEDPRGSAGRRQVSARVVATLVAEPLTTQVVLQRLVAHPATDVAEALARVVVGEPRSLRRLALVAPPL